MQRLFAVLAIIFLLALAGCKTEQADRGETPKEAADLPTYRIGYMICNSEKETLARFLPFTKYLGEQLGVRFETEAIDTIDFTRAVERLDFTHTNSLLYVILNRLHGVDVLAAEKKGSLGIQSQGIILVKSESDIQTVADLKGRSMIFGPMLAPTGFMSQLDVLQNHGLDPDKDLAFYTIPAASFKHEKVIYGVYFDKYDAGAIPLDDLETMQKDGRLEGTEFRILARGEEMPYCNFGVSQKIDEELARRFKEAVLAITPETTVEFEGERVKVLERALVDGYEDIADADFEVVREMAKRTNMPPYQKY